MICFQGPLICYITPEALPVMQTLYFSLEFFPRFFVGLCRIFLCANVLNFEYWHLPVACNLELIVWVWNLNENYIFLNENTFFCSQFSPHNTGNHILGFWNSKMFWGACPQTPLEEGGKWPLVDSVSYSIQTCWLLQLLLTPYMLKFLQSKNGSREEAEKNGARSGNAREVPLPDQACLVKMGGYWPSSFSAYFMNSQRR